jgi:Uma2 family endonuclease
MDPVLTPWRFTADQYQRMGETGILCEDDRVELIDGVIVEMTPVGLRHIATVDRCNREFTRQVGDRAIVRVQSPLRVSPRSEPQPDVTILRDRADFYAGGHAGPADVLLVVEVSEISLAYDRRVKLRLYAEAGVPEVWLVNLRDDCIEASYEPAGGRYQQRELLQRGAACSPHALPEVLIAVDAIL